MHEVIHIRHLPKSRFQGANDDAKRRAEPSFVVPPPFPDLQIFFSFRPKISRSPRFEFTFAGRQVGESRVECHFCVPTTEICVSKQKEKKKKRQERKKKKTSDFSFFYLLRSKRLAKLVAAPRTWRLVLEEAMHIAGITY
jgi:hypothetical protein